MVCLRAPPTVCRRRPGARVGRAGGLSAGWGLLILEQGLTRYYPYSCLFAQIESVSSILNSAANEGIVTTFAIENSIGVFVISYAIVSRRAVHIPKNCFGFPCVGVGLRKDEAKAFCSGID